MSFYPSGPGVEEGETCWRGYGCRDRLCFEPPECGEHCEDPDCEATHEGVYFCPSGCWRSDE